MMINKLTAVYFSPTGGTKMAVQAFAKGFPGYELTLIENTLASQRAKQYAFTENELAVVACPVYAGQLPQVQGILQNLKGSGTPCVLLACYGNRHYDDTLAQMQNILEQQGFRVIGGAAVIIPHIFAAIGQGRPDAHDQEVLADFAAAIEQKLQSGNLVSATFPGNPAPEIKAPIPVAKTFAEERCTMCGACINLCPVEALSVDDMEGDSSICISCMRCVKVCRPGARSFANEQIAAWLTSNFSAPREIEVFK